MKARNSKKILFVLAALFLSLSVKAQSEAIQNFKDKNYNCVSTYFLYESMIRTATTVLLDSSMSQMVEGARLVVYCSANKLHEDYRPELTEPVEKEVLKTDFEEMMSLKDGDTRAKVYKEEIGGDQSRILLLMDSAEQWTAIELTGEIDLGKLMTLIPKLMNDFSKFSNPF
ncbi:DUF4252 domain-containing protein [Halocola ammonii]